MDRSFADRIKAEILRGEMDSTQAEERARLEGWLVTGAVDPDAPARRICDQDD